MYILPTLSYQRHDKPQKSTFSRLFNQRKIELLHTGITGCAKIYRGFENAWNFKPTQQIIPYQWHAGIVHFYVQFNKPFHTLNCLSFIGIAVDFRNIFRNASLIQKTTEHARFDAAMHIMRAVGSLFENCALAMEGVEGLRFADKLNDILSTALKTACAASKSLMAIGAVLSITDLVIHARKWKRADDFYTDFIKNSGFREDQKYGHQEFNKFMVYLKKLDPKEIKDFYLVGGDLLKSKLIEMSWDVENDNTPRIQQLKSVILKLKVRLESTKTTYRVALISDSANLLSKALIVSKLFHPLGYVLMGVFTVGRFTMFVQRKISAYRFENEVGLIFRPKTIETHINDRFTRIKDFALWFFGFYKKIPIPKMAYFNFKRDSNSDLPLFTPSPNKIKKS